MSIALAGVQAVAGDLKLLDTRLAEVEKQFKSLDKAGDGAGKSFDKVFAKADSLGRGLSSLGTKLTVGLTAPIAAASAGMIKLASDAQESENLFNVVFGNMSRAARDFSEDFARSVRANAFEVRRQLGTFQQMTTAMGFSADAAFAMSKQLTTLTRDMSSFFNLRPEDAFQKITAGISGEIEPLKRLGIVLNETTLEQTAMTAGISKSITELDEQTKVMLRTITILQQTKTAQGDAAATADQFANLLRGVKDQFQEATATIGAAWLPAAESVLRGAANLISRFKEWAVSLSTASVEQKNFVIGLVAIGASIGPMLTVVGKLTTALIALRTAGVLVLIKPLTELAAIAAGLALSFEGLDHIASRMGFRGLQKQLLALNDELAAAQRQADLAGEAMAKAMQEVAAGDNSAVARLQEATSRLENAERTIDSIKKKIKETGGATLNLNTEPAENKVEEFARTIREKITGAVSGVGNLLTGIVAPPDSAPVDEMFNDFIDARTEAQKKADDLILQLQKQARERSEMEDEKAANKKIELAQKTAAEMERLEEEQLRFEVDTGALSLEEFLKIQQKKLEAVQAQNALTLDAGEELSADEIKREQDLARQVFQIRSKLHTDVNREMRDYFRDLSDEGKQTVTFLKGGFNSLSDGLTRLFTTGSFGFKQFMNSIKTGLAQLASNALVGALGSAIFGNSGFAGGGSIGGGGGAGGGLLSGFLSGAGSGIGSSFLGSVFSGFGLSDIFSGVGDFFSTIFSGGSFAEAFAPSAAEYFAPFHEGGFVPGTGFGDKVLARLEPGEFVVSRTGAQKNASLLQAINDNVPGYASGGQIRPATSADYGRVIGSGLIKMLISQFGGFGSILSNVGTFLSSLFSTGATAGTAAASAAASTASSTASSGASLGASSVGGPIALAAALLKMMVRGRDDPVSRSLDTLLAPSIQDIMARPGWSAGSLLLPAVSLADALTGGNLFGTRRSVGPAGGATLGSRGGFFQVVNSGGDNGFDPSSISSALTKLAQQLNIGLLREGLRAPDNFLAQLEAGNIHGGLLVSVPQGMNSRGWGEDVNGAMTDLLMRGLKFAPPISGVPDLAQPAMNTIATGRHNLWSTFGDAWQSFVSQAGNFKTAASLDSGNLVSAKFANGGSARFNTPSLISVAEAGPEDVVVTPLGKGGGKEVHIHFHGPTILDEVSMAQFERRLANAVRRAA